VGSRVSIGDHPDPDQLIQRTLQRLRAFPQAGLQHASDLIDLSLFDQRADRGVGHQHLEGGDSPAAHCSDQLLVNDAGEAARKLHANLLLLRSDEAVDDSVDGLRSVVRVKRGKNQVACLM
jgi:hypothetical protein